MSIELCDVFSQVLPNLILTTLSIGASIKVTFEAKGPFTIEIYSVVWSISLRNQERKLKINILRKEQIHFIIECYELNKKIISLCIEGIIKYTRKETFLM